MDPSIKLDGQLYIFRGHRLQFSNYIVVMSLKIVIIKLTHADSDEMLQNVASLLGCLRM